MKIHCLDGRKQEGFVTFGSVYKEGELSESTGFKLENEDGEYVPVQSRITAYWPDGSVKWAAHTADASKIGSHGEVLICPRVEETIRSSSISSIQVIRKNDSIKIDTGKISLEIPNGKNIPADYLAKNVRGKNGESIPCIYPILKLEEKGMKDGCEYRMLRSFRGEIQEVSLEEAGALQTVICFKGKHKQTGGERLAMPFVVRMYLWADREDIRFVHTFFYDGEGEKDFLKGMGICFETVLTGEKYLHHVKFGTEANSFHEAAVLLNCSYPRLNGQELSEQMKGELTEYPSDSVVAEAARDLPIWNHYYLLQDSAYHYSVKKQTKKECCRILCREGKHAQGTMAVSGKNGGLILGIRDCWKKYPSGLSVSELGEEKASCTAWFYSPDAESYDFRHYDTRSYPRSSYEGYEDVAACAYGIAVTSECCMKLVSGVVSDKELKQFGENLNKPPVYAADPEYYHEKRAFGYWSLVSEETEAEAYLEEQMRKAAEFYIQEVDARDWYGLFDYGDVMHTYDDIRHCWRYDMGGFAWQNTELVPTYWLWLYFLRTGREDIFSLAEAMTRHCSEVDMYHFGNLQGLGTRHNVRHWGCSCKEPRIGMAGHHRFYYYLTGDHRIGDVMEESKDGDLAMKYLSHFPQGISEEENGDSVTEVRSGPDWTSFVSNWMTQYERTLDRKYLDKIRKGIDDIAKMPFGLASGPEYLYHEKDGHLEYIGEHEESFNMHLQVCQGGTEIWLELLEVLRNVAGSGDVFRKLLADYGEFYMLSAEEKTLATDGKIITRPFSFPYFAGALSAYAAFEKNNVKLSERVVEELRKALEMPDGTHGFVQRSYAEEERGSKYLEIPGITTNATSQWCLNMIVALDFIRDFFSV